MSTTYTIKASLLPRGGWALVVDEIGVSQVRRLDQAEDEMRSALEDLQEVTGQDASQAQFRLQVDLPAQVSADLETVERGQAEAERLTREAREARRALVEHLHHDLHLPLRDIAVIVDVSYQRVSAILKSANTDAAA